jgi:hypothetical protein
MRETKKGAKSVLILFLIIHNYLPPRVFMMMTLLTIIQGNRKSNWAGGRKGFGPWLDNGHV